MRLSIDVRLRYSLASPSDILLQIEAAGLSDQFVAKAHIGLSDTEHFGRVPGEDAIGERIWLRMENEFVCDYSSTIDINRPSVDLPSLAATPPHQLTGDAVSYLMPSRYCPSDSFMTFVGEEFGDVAGGAKIAAIRDWIAERFTYVPGVSGSQTTALESFVERRGVCRDYAHVMVTLARAAAIPARFVSVYAPRVTPQDFHAVTQVYLDGDWRLVDPTGMAEAEEMAIVGVGRDAADAAFMTVYGAAELMEQEVAVTTV